MVTRPFPAYLIITRYDVKNSVEQLTAALELFGRQLRQNYLREVAADGGSERGSNWWIARALE